MHRNGSTISRTSHKGASINYVAKRERQTICQKTSFTTKTEVPFSKIRGRQKFAGFLHLFIPIINYFKEHFQSKMISQLNAGFFWASIKSKKITCFQCYCYLPFIHY